MKWVFAPARKAFSDVRRDWDELNKSRGNHILLDSIFVESALKYFGDDSVLLGIRRDPRRPGLAMVSRRAFGSWETFQPSQSPLGFLLLPAKTPADDLAELTRALPGFALQVGVLQQDPDYAMVSRGTEDQRFEFLDYIETGKIVLTGTFDEYWKARSINLRHKVSRLRRRLAEKNHKPELSTLRNPADVKDALRAYAALESKGWKSQTGTAITLDNAQGLFYQEILERFGANGETTIYQYRVGDTVIATDLCLVRGDILYVLKTTYDEEWREYSPAILMREEITKQLFEEGRVRTLEFYGRVMDWHRQWTSSTRIMYHVNYFRGPWVRSLKALVKSRRSKQPDAAGASAAATAGGADNNKTAGPNLQESAK
jgi:hypothetical protein